MGYAEGIGFNTMRVYLSTALLTKSILNGFKKQMDYVSRVSLINMRIKTMFVILIDVLGQGPKIGKPARANYRVYPQLSRLGTRSGDPWPSIKRPEAGFPGPWKVCM